MKAVSTMTSKGQITIPFRIRKALGLKNHDRIDFEIKDDQVILTPNRHSLIHLYGIAKSQRKPVDKTTMRKMAESDLMSRWNKKSRQSP